MMMVLFLSKPCLFDSFTILTEININIYIEKNEPKYAETDFEKLFYDEKSNTSVVMAKPKTGRTHQIRIHLRYLGYPIANDPCYGGIVYNGLKDLDNPDFLKFHQIVPHINSVQEKDTGVILNY